MCLNPLLCYSAVRWKSVISRWVKIYKSAVGKWEKKNHGRQKKGRWEEGQGGKKEAHGEPLREINTIHQPHEGKFRPSLFHESLRKVDGRRFVAPLQSLWRETRYLLHTRISKCCFFFFFFFLPGCSSTCCPPFISFLGLPSEVFVSRPLLPTISLEH